MNFHIKVEMLVTVAVLYLAFGMSDGRVLGTCELGQDLNSTLPADLLAKIPNLVAKIVCYVGLSSQFNTSTITYVGSVPGSKGGQKCRPAEGSSSEESSGDDSNSSSSEERRKRSASGTSSEEFSGDDSKSSSSEERRKRSASGTSSDDSNSSSSEERRKRSASGASSEQSNGDDSNSSSSEERRKRSASSSSEESNEEKIQGPKPGFNSSTVKPVTKYQANNVTSQYFRGRKYRSAESSSEESSGNDSDSSSSEERRRRSASKASSEESSEENRPLNNSSSSMVTPVTRPPVNNSVNGNRQRHGRSAKPNIKECNEKNMWTLYGLFQLPDRIVCTSGLKPSLNLCNLPCSSLLDDNIEDDITCFKTVLNKFLSEENKNGPNKELFNKLRVDIFTQKCKNEKDSSFSTC